MYDSGTDTLFFYVNNVTVQNLGKGEETTTEEACLWLDPSEIPKMIEHLQTSYKEYLEYGPRCNPETDS